MEDKISVIVPIYNTEKYLKQCLDSLARQKHSNYEVILVDDCSADGSAAAAAEYTKKFPHIFHLIRNDSRQEAAGARNTGMKAASGEWLAFADSDDWVTEDYLSSMFETAVKDEADIVMSSIYYYYSDSKIKLFSPFQNLTTQSSQKEKVALVKPYQVTRLFRRSLVTESGLEFPTNVWRASEQGIIIPLLTRTDRISIYPKPMYYYRQRQDSNSNNNSINVDVSFYPRSVENVEAYSMPGFETELEFRAVSDLMYGMIMIMIRSKKSGREITDQIDIFNKKYPDWKKNPYLPHLNKSKRAFVYFSGRKRLLVLKLLILAWDIKEKIHF